jgi:hypothetical protein
MKIVHSALLSFSILLVSQLAPAATCSNNSVGGGWTCVNSVLTTHSGVNPWVTGSISLTAGNLAILTLAGNYSSVVTVADSQLNTWTLGCADTTAGGAHTTHYYAVVGTTGATTVTITLVGAASGRTAVHQYSGNAASGVLDGTCVSGSANPGTSATTSSITTSQANSLLFAGVHAVEDVSSAGSGYTLRESTGGASLGGEDRLAATAGSYTASINCGNGAVVIQLMSFKPAAEAGSPPRRVILVQ